MNSYKTIFPYGGSLSEDAALPINLCEFSHAPGVCFVVDEIPEQVFETGVIYAVSETLRNELETHQITGIKFEPCRIIQSSQPIELNGHIINLLPRYYRLIINSIPKSDDCGLEKNNVFITSENVATVLQNHQINELELILIN